MRIILDIEADGLRPTQIWCIVTKDVDTNDVQVFYGEELRTRFPVFIKQATQVIGHNILEYDIPAITRLLDVHIDPATCYDTLVVSRLLDSGRDGGHSLEAFGEKLNHPKGEHEDFSQFSAEMLEYCKNDVELNHKVYRYLNGIVARNSKAFRESIALEHRIHLVCLEMSGNGFAFDLDGLEALDAELAVLISDLDRRIQDSFPPKVEHIQLKTKVKTVITPFNPGSPKQIVDRLWDNGWRPTERTKTHTVVLKEKPKTPEAKELRKKRLERLERYGWKVNELNLATLPETAEEGCRLLVEHILLSARRRTLAEWRAAYVAETGRIHGRFNSLGTVTQRCSHSSPNMGNIATKKSIKYNTPRLKDLATSLGGRMRGFWMAPEGRYLVGTDMESAHLRIFAHLIDDKEFTQSLISGKKEDGSDPHSVNKRRLGALCVDRDRAKTFIFSFLNGAGAAKVAEIFACSLQEATQVLDEYIKAYPGLERLKQETIPRDAARGYFIGVDGRLVKCDSEHKMIGMYLQNMESVLMKYANLDWRDTLDGMDLYEAGGGQTRRWSQVNWVHDEWVTEVQGSKEYAEVVGRVQSESISRVGERFGLRCPMAGEYKVGKNWLEIH